MTSLIPWRAPREMSVFRRLFDEVIDEFFNFRPLLPLHEDEYWAPSVDVSETEREFIVKAELPGVDPKDIEVSVHKDLLTIKGERRQEREEKDENYHLIERCYGSFCRSLRLPTEVRADEAEADYEKGILRIRLPKHPDHIPTRIQVKAA